MNGEFVASEEIADRLRANYEEALTIQRLDHTTLATGVLGGASLIVSALLWSTVKDIPPQPRAAVGWHRGAFVWEGSF